MGCGSQEAIIVKTPATMNSIYGIKFKIPVSNPSRASTLSREGESTPVEWQQRSFR
jgi:hypothetical protein